MEPNAHVPEYTDFSNEPADKRRVDFTPAPEPGQPTTRFRVRLLDDLAARVRSLPEPNQFSAPYSTITISVGPTVWDPTDQGPIFIRPERVNIAARTLFSKLAVWYLRRYVLAIVRGQK